MLTVTGVNEIIQQPAILAALNPLNGLAFLRSQGWHMFIAVGAIVLAFTGAEALYADMGHFGKRPIQYAWLGLVLPALAINYMGQGALLMRDPSAMANPFYKLFPEAWLIPAVILATFATVIASQAVISGAYSMTKQAMQLGLLPRMQVFFTSTKEVGQIYMPAVNWLLLVSVLLAVVGFGSSSALASAYGIAVTFTMLITTLLTFFVVRHGWGYPLPVALAATGVFLALDTLLVHRLLAQIHARRLVPAGIGHSHLHHHGDLETGSRAVTRAIFGRMTQNCCPSSPPCLPTQHIGYPAQPSILLPTPTPFPKR